MRARSLGLLLAAAVAAACGRPSGGAAQATARPHYLAGVPVIPGSIINDTTGSPEVEHRGFIMQVPMDSVVRFYRRELAAHAWQVLGDVADTSRVNLYLQRDSISLWVQIHKLGPLATEWALTATGKTAAPPPAARR